MKTRSLIILCALFILLGLAGLALAGQTPASAQAPFASPTPGPDGRIIYIVKAGDNCTSIAVQNGVSPEYLRTTNNLDENCSLREGQVLLLGVGGPSAASPTPGPSQTPTPAQPTNTPIAGGMAKVCVLVYEDANGDALRQVTEGALAGAALSLTSLDGSFSQTQVTTLQPDPDAYQGMCFENVPQGQYNISGAPPAGYNPTIQMTSTLSVVPGDTAFVDFGAQLQTQGAGGGQPKGTSPLLGILGALFLLVGIGLGGYTWRMMRKR